MADRRDDIWEGRADRAYSDLTYKPKRTLAKWAVGIGLVLIFIALIAGIGKFACGWGNEAARIAGPQNTREQFTALYDLYENMQATAGNVCDVKNSEASVNSPVIIEDPEFAYAAQYRRIEAEYNRRMENEFEAEWLLIHPDGLPHRAPSLDDMLVIIGCTK